MDGRVQKLGGPGQTKLHQLWWVGRSSTAVPISVRLERDEPGQPWELMVLVSQVRPHVQTSSACLALRFAWWLAYKDFRMIGNLQARRHRHTGKWATHFHRHSPVLWR